MYVTYILERNQTVHYFTSTNTAQNSGKLQSVTFSERRGAKQSELAVESFFPQLVLDLK